VGNIRKLVLATQNKGKIAEFQRLLGTFAEDIQVLGLAEFPEMPDVEETGSTFGENALIKAREVSEFTKLPALADDSGLCIDLLNGDPGIFSARWAGVHGDDAGNIAKVLEQLIKYRSEKSSEYREAVDAIEDKSNYPTARFKCAVCLVFPSGHRNFRVQVLEEGELLGVIVREPRGKSGFGYDPIFQPAGYDLTLGEFASSEKDRISHRAQAFTKIAPKISALI